MARKVINTTHAANRYDILSQTPKNYNSENYFLKELQEKVDFDWPYRPNRVDIEYENAWGQQTYSPIEVVIQSVRSEKGTAISDDSKKLVFRDILEKRFRVGSRFRFGNFTGQNGVEDVDALDRNVWLAVNNNSTNMTAAVVVERCNGLLGSCWIDPATGLSVYHYEPVILPQFLSSVSLLYEKTIVEADADVVAIVQTNAYTRKYFTNQRFILGYGAERKQVYRIKSIHDFYSSTTSIANHVQESQGLTRLYLEITEASPADDFEHRIAVQTAGSPVVVKPIEPDAVYTLGFAGLTPVPAYLGNDALILTPQLIAADGSAIPAAFTLTCELENLPEGVATESYLSVSQEDSTFTLKRHHAYLGGDLILRWCVSAADSPTGADLEYTMSLGMGQYA